MRQATKTLIVLAILFFLSGCSGFLVFASSDPSVKLSDAGYLFDEYGRPLIAERLIREAIDIYQEQNDEVGLAEAYRVYGFFFRSRSIEKWNEFYRKHGFLDKAASFDGRYQKSIEYFEKSHSLFHKYAKYDALTNVNLNMGRTYMLMNNRDKACTAYEESLENNRQNLTLNPEAKIALPAGYATYEDYISAVKKRAGCEGAA
jgi:tetratricopeptide (TPR) repeat protein